MERDGRMDGDGRLTGILNGGDGKRMAAIGESAGDDGRTAGFRSHGRNNVKDT